MDDDLLQIGEQDTVIILREDGICDISFPDIDSNHEIPENIITGAAILNALKDQELSELIHESFAQKCEEYAITAPANDND